MHRTQQRPDGSLEENSEINGFVEIVQLKLGLNFDGIQRSKLTTGMVK